jgi:hypothetical protein
MDGPMGIAVFLAIGSAFRTEAGCWIFDPGESECTFGEKQNIQHPETSTQVQALPAIGWLHGL